MSEENLKKLCEKMCQQMAADLSLADALMVIQKSIESCVKETMDTYSDKQKEEAYNYFFVKPEIEQDVGQVQD